MHKNIDFLGIKIASIRKMDIVSLLLNFGQDTKKRMAFYLNAHCVNLACSDHYYKTILNQSDLLYAGGKGVVWASRFLGSGLPERVNILDFFDAFSKEARLRKTSFYLLGGTNEVVSGAANILRSNGLNILGFRHGFFTAEEEKDIVREINTLQPNVLMVGMGVPKQEKWIYEHSHVVSVNLLWGVGAAFEWLSGKRKRAPGWMIEYGLEWLHRFCQQPLRLWRRYLIGNLLFVFRVLAWKMNILGRHDQKR
jgi:N-acetylglucosaminyldiphosphoundecaprenol N-acetyl-beta-D-mannosaminyltransferase